jgi:hypothetical protein
MKKVFLASAFAVLGIIALSSCKKDYTCTPLGSTTGITYPDLSKSEAETVETACKFGGGTWTKN